MSKVWFITGAGSGIGAATARAVVKAGDRVVATGRNLNKVRKALGDIAGESVAFVALDVTSEAQAKAAVEEAVDAFGRIDVLVNSAGYSLLGKFRGIDHRRNPKPDGDQFLRRYVRDARGLAGHAQATVRPHHQHRLARRCHRLQALRSL
jgi:NAD(P)-dependent dehydrogenase (short-subunit alcohol dehydrogenase family)